MIFKFFKKAGPTSDSAQLASAEACKRRGNAFLSQGELEQAAACYRDAMALKADYADAWLNLGYVLKEQGQLDEAQRTLQQAALLRPTLADAFYMLGEVARQRGDLSGAIAQFTHALEIKPEFEIIYGDLCSVLFQSGQKESARKIILQGIERNPANPEFHCYLGNLHVDDGELDQAVASYGKALTTAPTYVEAHYNLGVALQAQGRLPESKASYRRALELAPEYEDAFCNLLFLLNYHPDKSAEQIFAGYQEYDRRFGLPHRGAWRAHPNNRDAKRRLKVGYVSPDLRRHPAQYFLEPLLAHHDKSAVDVYAYAELIREDGMTARYRGYADHWVATLGMSDAQLAERIRADGIDILVDLAGHTGQNRLQVFAMKPAPVSVSWLGFGYTTGLSAIDYFLTDGPSVPAGSEGLFSETPWRLPGPCFAYRPAEGMGPVSPLPATSKGYVTFGTLTRGLRINHRTIRVWAVILKRVAGARLVIDSVTFAQATEREAMTRCFAAHGIGPEQLEIGHHSPPWDVLRGLDIGFDCFPHNSGTTLFETIYMGVPYITLAGRPSVGRLGSSILEGAGHPEWIATSEEEYIEKAVALANDLPALAKVRAGLRGEMEAGPFRDEAGFARMVEMAYRDMFARWAKAGDD